MEFDQLRGFVTVASEGSFTKAAEKLFLTQPALSLQIKALEQELSQPLFERQGRQLLLTEAGRILLEQAKQLLALVEQTEQEIAALKGLQRGRVRIGASDTTCLYLLPSVVQRFRQQFPAIELHLTNRPSGEIINFLTTGQIDFGIVTLPALNPNIAVETLFWREEVLICRPGHPLLTVGAITPTDLARYPLLLLEKSSTSRALLDQLFAQRSLTPQIIDLGSIEVIKRYVEIDLGISVVPTRAVAAEVAAGRLQTLRLDWLPAPAVGLVQRRNGFLSPASRTFLEMLRAEVATTSQLIKP